MKSHISWESEFSERPVSSELLQTWEGHTTRHPPQLQWNIGIKLSPKTALLSMEFSILIFSSSYMKKIICICFKKKARGREKGENMERLLEHKQ